MNQIPKTQLRSFRKRIERHKINQGILKNGLLGDASFINRKGFFVLGKSSLILLSILIQLFIVSLNNFVKADSFYPSGDSMKCEFAQVSSLSIRSLPVNSTQPSTYSFDASKVYGEGSGFVENHNLLDLAELRFPNARRYLGVADNVKVPPNSEIDLGYYYFNYSNHQIYASNLVAFLSSGKGDITKLISTSNLSNLNNSSNLSYLFNGGNYVKIGKTISTELNRNYEISNWSNPPKGKLLTTFYVEDPLEVVDKQIKYHFDEFKELHFDFEIKVKNISEYTQQNIQLNYSYGAERFEGLYSFIPGESYSYKFSTRAGNPTNPNFNLRNFTISNPNSQRECLVNGVPLGSLSSDIDARMLFLYRGDVSAPQNWLGIQEDFTFQPEGQTMCIERIPYKFTSETIQTTILNSVTGTINLSSNENINTSNLQLKCEEEFSSKIEIRNESLKIASSKLELNFNPYFILPSLNCGGKYSEDGKKIIWQITDLDFSELWSCNLDWKLINPFENQQSLNMRICYLDGDCREISSASISISADSCLSINSPKEIVLLPGEVGRVNFEVVNNSFEVQKVQYEFNQNNNTNEIEIPKNISEDLFTEVKYEETIDAVCLNLIDKFLVEATRCVQIIRILPLQLGIIQNTNILNNDLQIIGAVFTTPQILANNLSQIVENVNTPEGIRIPVIQGLINNSSVLSDTGDSNVLKITLLAFLSIIAILMITKYRKRRKFTCT